MQIHKFHHISEFISLSRSSSLISSLIQFPGRLSMTPRYRTSENLVLRESFCAASCPIHPFSCRPTSRYSSCSSKISNAICLEFTSYPLHTSQNCLLLNSYMKLQLRIVAFYEVSLIWPEPWTRLYIHLNMAKRACISCSSEYLPIITHDSLCNVRWGENQPGTGGAGRMGPGMAEDGRSGIAGMVSGDGRMAGRVSPRMARRVSRDGRAGEPGWHQAGEPG